MINGPNNMSTLQVVEDIHSIDLENENDPISMFSPAKKRPVEISSDEEDDYANINKKPKNSYYTLDYYDNLADSTTTEEFSRDSDFISNEYTDKIIKDEKKNCNTKTLNIEKEEINFLNGMLSRRDKNKGQLIKPRRTTAHIAGMIEVPTRETAEKRKKNSMKWTVEQDSDLVSMALLYAAKKEDLRSLETYKEIMECTNSLKKMKEPECIFARLKYLCHEKRKDILEEHCGVYDLTLDSATRKNAALGAKKLRCCVLDIDDIFLYDLQDNVKFYVPTPRSQKIFNRSEMIKYIKKNNETDKRAKEREYFN